MKNVLKSEGVCVFCENTYTKSGIHRHLKKHLEEEQMNHQSGTSYLVKIETESSWGKTPYFLSLWVDGNAHMKDLDDFLKKIWLECCGHMSSFTDPKKKIRRDFGFDFFEAEELLQQGKITEYEALMEERNGEIPMRRKVKKAFYKGLKLTYDYDFGSTTSLEINIVEVYKMKAPSGIVLLSRNEALDLKCDCCGKEKATRICSRGYYDGHEEELFCDQCAKEHSNTCEHEVSMKVINSPRMGVCAYNGGEIDIDRD